jgi:hypothetical protein
MVNRSILSEKVIERFSRVRGAVFSSAGWVSERLIEAEEHLHCSDSSASRAKVHQGLVDFVHFLGCLENGGLK